jgi:hypothetical protein
MDFPLPSHRPSPAPSRPDAPRFGAGGGISCGPAQTSLLKETVAHGDQNGLALKYRTVSSSPAVLPCSSPHLKSPGPELCGGSLVLLRLGAVKTTPPRQTYRRHGHAVLTAGAQKKEGASKPPGEEVGAAAVPLETRRPFRDWMRCDRSTWRARLVMGTSASHLPPLGE